MPRSEKSKGSNRWTPSFTLKSILARAKNGNQKNKAKAMDRLLEGDKDASLSIKDRVLAKLQEPRSSDMKQAARHSVDAPTSTIYYRGGGAELEGASTPSRHSTSSSSVSHWTLHTEPAIVQASLHPYHRNHSRSGIRGTGSSPTSNVIARLMGLGDSDAADLRHTPKPHRATAGNSFPLNVQVRPRRRPEAAASYTASTSGRDQRIITTRGQSISGFAQNSLDEMEDHLRQCDKALERIEAVMQLKKKLLYLNRSVTNSNRHDVYDHRRGEELSKQHRSIRSRHARSSSMDHNANITMRRWYDNETEHRDKAPPTLTHAFQHRRSVSDGGTPVFCPHDIELDISSRRMDARLPRPTPDTPKICLKHGSNSNLFADSEQPSPVSVLDTSNNDSSEDDPPDSPVTQEERNTKREKKKPGSVVRALWCDEPPAPANVAAKCKSGEEDEAAEIMQWMDRMWVQGIGGEVSEVAARVECVILRRLVEETIMAVALGCTPHPGRTRGDP